MSARDFEKYSLGTMQKWESDGSGGADGSEGLGTQGRGRELGGHGDDGRTGLHGGWTGRGPRETLWVERAWACHEGLRLNRCGKTPFRFGKAPPPYGRSPRGDFSRRNGGEMAVI